MYLNLGGLNNCQYHFGGYWVTYYKYRYHIAQKPILIIQAPILLGSWDIVSTALRTLTGVIGNYGYRYLILY